MNDKNDNRFYEDLGFFRPGGGRNHIACYALNIQRQIMDKIFLSKQTYYDNNRGLVLSFEARAQMGRCFYGRSDGLEGSFTKSLSILHG